VVQRPLMNRDGGCFGKPDHPATGNAGKDAAVERRCEEGAVADGEQIGAGCLQHASVGIYYEWQPGQAGLCTVEQRAVSPLVGAESAGDREAVQRGLPRRLSDLAKRGFDFQPIGTRHDIDSHHAIRFRRVHSFKRGDGLVRIQLGEAGLEAGEVGVELDRVAVEDEQGLEDAVARIGHGGIVATSGRLKTLLIDNYDSFTYNLFQLLAEVNGEEPVVVRNDAAPWDELAALGFDNVVISPGPGRPERVDDFGVCAEAIRNSAVPLLGVCLGHQGLGALYGATTVPAPEPVHGRLSAILHDDSSLFAGIPREFQAVRYHSLCVEQPLPDELRGIAWTSDGVLMALEHRERPLWGVQFHPESVCTEHGRRLLENFRDLSRSFSGRASGVVGRAPWGHSRPDSRASPALSIRPSGSAPTTPSRRLEVRRLDRLIDPELVFVSLYGESENAFWLDSSRTDGDARFSFMGDDGGPLGAAITYDVEAREVRIERGGEVVMRRESVFDYLARELARARPEVAEELPFEFDCGFAGWLGYELKAECGGDAAHESALPDAALIFAGRMLAFDHAQGDTYMLALAEPDGEREAGEWLAVTAQTLAGLPDASGRLFGAHGPPKRSTDNASEPRLARSRERYLEEIAECKRLLAEGETYEVCLTNSVLADPGDVDPLDLYRALREVNPSPFSSYVRFGQTAVLSSSPERFLRVGRDRWVEAKPIKGTSRRGATAAEDVRLAERLRGDEKNRAENLMIADLLRNDLGSVCEVGTVHVPALMQVESYETVHQLVTTVRGLLGERRGPLDCVRACFPPGSMTGAPKLRTMRILDELEGAARGVYSGAIGYFGLGGGCDLSVAIRTIVLDGDAATIGAGGAIVTQSDPEDELDEMLLKAAAPLRAIDPGIAPARAPASVGPPRAGSGSLRRSPA
jgi:para-aminobenzoate synthetase